MDTLDMGVRLSNGSWTGALGQLQSGIIDIWASLFTIIPDRFDQFLCTTPMMATQYAALMLRPRHFIDINTNGLLAGIDISVYVLLFLSLTLLCIIGYLNEKRHAKQSGGDDVNSLWTILVLLMPYNEREWKHEFGITRKVIILSCNFTILLLTTYYQSNQLQQLMLPSASPKVTFEDISRAVLQHKSKIVFEFKNSAIEVDIVDSRNNEMSSLASAMNENRPIYEYEEARQIELVNNENAILIDDVFSITSKLSRLAVKDCSKYVMVPIAMGKSHWVTLMLRKERIDVLESINVIIAERFDAVQEIATTYPIDEQCIAHLNSQHTPSPSYISLNLYTLSGCFVSAILFFILAAIFLSAEIVYFKYFQRRNSEQNTLKTEHLKMFVSLSIDEHFTMSEYEHIVESYTAFIDCLERYNAAKVI
jgi:hypothetical protein